jgi:hypothetical protein
MPVKLVGVLVTVGVSEGASVADLVGGRGVCVGANIGETRSVDAGDGGNVVPKDDGCSDLIVEHAPRIIDNAKSANICLTINHLLYK